MSTTILQKLNVWKNKFQHRIYGHDRENNPGGKTPMGGLMVATNLKNPP